MTRSPSISDVSRGTQDPHGTLHLDLPHTKLAQRYRSPLVFIDLETTGLHTTTFVRMEDGKPHQYGPCTITEVAAIITEPGNPHKVLDRYEAKVRQSQSDLAHADPQALRVNGYDHAEWERDGKDRLTAATELWRFIAGNRWVGHNIEFDRGFLRAFYNGLDFGIDYERQFAPVAICTQQLAKCVWPKESVSLRNCCERLGIEPEGVHRAMGGAERCRLVFCALTEAARKGLQ